MSHGQVSSQHPAGGLGVCCALAGSHVGHTTGLSLGSPQQHCKQPLSMTNQHRKESHSLSLGWKSPRGAETASRASRGFGHPAEGGMTLRRDRLQPSGHRTGNSCDSGGSLAPVGTPHFWVPRNTPSCFLFLPAWPCCCPAWEGGKSNCFGLFLIQECQLHPAVRLLEICWVLFASCG